MDYYDISSTLAVVNIFGQLQEPDNDRVSVTARAVIRRLPDTCVASSRCPAQVLTDLISSATDFGKYLYQNWLSSGS